MTAKQIIVSNSLVTYDSATRISFHSLTYDNATRISFHSLTHFVTNCKKATATSSVVPFKLSSHTCIPKHHQPFPIIAPNFRAFPEQFQYFL